MKVYVEAEAPRVCCPEHGVVVQQFPWARRHSKFTRNFEDTAVWLSLHLSRKAVAEYLRISYIASRHQQQPAFADLREQDESDYHRKRRTDPKSDVFERRSCQYRLADAQRRFQRRRFAGQRVFRFEGYHYRRRHDNRAGEKLRHPRRQKDVSL